MLMSSRGKCIIEVLGGCAGYLRVQHTTSDGLLVGEEDWGGSGDSRLAFSGSSLFSV